MQKDSSPLPDVTIQAMNNTNQPLKWVGMEKIGLPMTLPLTGSKQAAISVHADIFVSLDKPVKGIHMSRLFLSLNDILANNELTLENLNRLLDSALQSHIELSQAAKVVLSFDLPLHKKALLSNNYGYQLYPAVLTQELSNGVSRTTLELTIPYSSTCPCSSSLANQLNAELFEESFSSEMVSKEQVQNWLKSREVALATPHNQRSYAYLKLQLTPGSWLSIEDLIWQFESTIGTPVQTAVKREDEQEFARLNGSNLLFCEDSARRVKAWLVQSESIDSYWYKIEHQESLHAHNAVAIDWGQLPPL